MRESLAKTRRPEPAPSPLLARMHPNIRRQLPLFRELDHPNRRRVAGPSARSAFLTPTTFDLKPTKPTIDALLDCWRGLSRPAIRFHLERPCFRFSAIGLTGRLGGALSGALGPYFCPDDWAAVNRWARLGAHSGRLQPLNRVRAMPLGLPLGTSP
jgi:hypothetical protein